MKLQLQEQLDLLKDGRAGRDGDGDGILNEGGKKAATVGAAAFVGASVGSKVGALTGAAAGAAAAHKMSGKAIRRTKMKVAVKPEVKANLAPKQAAVWRRGMRNKIIRSGILKTAMKTGRIGSLVGTVAGAVGAAYAADRATQKGDFELELVKLLKADGRAGRDGDGDGILNEGQDGEAPDTSTRQGYKRKRQENEEYRAKTTQVIQEERGKTVGPLAGAAAGFVAGAVSGARVGRDAVVKPGPTDAAVGLAGKKLFEVAGAGLGAAGAFVARNTPGLKGTARGRLAGMKIKRGVKAAAGKAGEKIGTHGSMALFDYPIAGVSRFMERSGYSRRQRAVAGALIGGSLLAVGGAKAGAFGGQLYDTFMPRRVEKLEGSMELAIELELKKWSKENFDESKVKRGSDGKFASYGTIAAVAGGTAAALAGAFLLGRRSGAAKVLSSMTKKQQASIAKKMAQAKKSPKASRGLAEGIFKKTKAQVVSATKAGLKAFRDLPLREKFQTAGLVAGTAWTGYEVFKEFKDDIGSLKPRINFGPDGITVNIEQLDKEGKVRSRVNYDTTSGKVKGTYIPKGERPQGGNTASAGGQQQGQSYSSSSGPTNADVQRKQQQTQNFKDWSQEFGPDHVSGRSYIDADDLDATLSAIRADFRSHKLDYSQAQELVRLSDYPQRHRLPQGEEAYTKLRNRLNNRSYKHQTQVDADYLRVSVYPLQGQQERDTLRNIIRVKAEESFKAGKLKDDDGVDNRKGRDADSDGKKDEVANKTTNKDTAPKAPTAPSGVSEQKLANMHERNQADAVERTAERAAEKASGGQMIWDKVGMSQEEWKKLGVEKQVEYWSKHAKADMPEDLRKAALFVNPRSARLMKFQESKIIRQPRGSDKGGEFAPKGGASSGGTPASVARDTETIGTYFGSSAAFRAVSAALRSAPGKIGIASRMVAPPGAGAVGGITGGAAGEKIAGDAPKIKEGRAEGILRQTGGAVLGLAAGVGTSLATLPSGPGAIAAGVAADTAGGYAGEKIGAAVGRYFDKTNPLLVEKIYRKYIKPVAA